MESSTEHLIQVLRSAIPALGYTQKEVEQRLGLSPGYLSRLFGGQIDLKVDHVVQIAKVLKVDSEVIFQLAFREFHGEPTQETRRLQERLGITAPEPSPSVLSEIEKDIERIVQRVLDKRGS